MADLYNNASENVYNLIDTKSREWDVSHNPKLGVDLGRLMLRKDPGNGSRRAKLWNTARLMKATWWAYS